MLSRTPLELDERGFKKLNKLLAKTHDQALAIAAESAARHTEGKSQHVFPTELGDPALQARELEEREGPRRAAGPLRATSCPVGLGSLDRDDLRGLAALDLQDHLLALLERLAGLQGELGLAALAATWRPRRSSCPAGGSCR